MHENRNKQIKKGVSFNLPWGVDGRVDVGGGLIVDWNKTATHRDNYTIIEAIIKEVRAEPVCYLSPAVE